MPNGRIVLVVRDLVVVRFGLDQDFVYAVEERLGDMYLLRKGSQWVCVAELVMGAEVFTCS